MTCNIGPASRGKRQPILKHTDSRLDRVLSMPCENGTVTDFVQCKEWTRPPVHPVAMVRGIDQERRTQLPWKDLKPDHLDARLSDGTEASFESPDELAAWLERHAEVEPREIFLRWTEGGRSAAPGMARIAIRIGSPTTLWVGCQEEARSVGMFQLLLRAIDNLDSVGRSAGLEPKTSHHGSGRGVAGADTTAPVLPRSKHPAPSVLQAPLTATHTPQNALFQRIMTNAWTVGIGTAVIAGVILLLFT